MKTNHKLSILHTVLNVLCGAVLALHRGMTAAGWQALLTVGLGAALVTGLAGLGVTKVRASLRLKPAQTDKGCYAMLAAGGLLFLAAAVLALPESNGHFLSLITVLFMAACGVALLVRLAQRDQGELAAVCSLAPIFFLCFYLLMFYRENGDNPYLFRFGYEIAVIILSLVGLYFAVAGKFQEEKPALRAAVCGISLTFVMQELIFVVIAPQQRALLAGFTLSTAVMLLACGVLLCCGLFYPPVRAVFPPPEPDSDPEGKDADPDEPNAE